MFLAIGGILSVYTRSFENGRGKKIRDKELTRMGESESFHLLWSSMITAVVGGGAKWVLLALQNSLAW